MNPIRLFLFFLILGACSPRKNSVLENPNNIAQSKNKKNSSPRVLHFQTDEAIQALLPDIRNALLMPDPVSGEVFFNPGSEQELIALNPDLPNLAFREQKTDFSLMNLKPWLLSSKEGPQALILNLVLMNAVTRRQTSKFNLQESPSRESLIKLLKLRLQEATQPNSFQIFPQQADSPEQDEMDDSNRPFFFSLMNPYSEKTLLGRACGHARSFLFALQLGKSIKPESSIEVPLGCRFSVGPATGDGFHNSLPLMGLALPWRSKETEKPVFQSFNDLVTPEKYPPNPDDARR